MQENGRGVREVELLRRGSACVMWLQGLEIWGHCSYQKGIVPLQVKWCHFNKLHLFHWKSRCKMVSFHLKWNSVVLHLNLNSEFGIKSSWIPILIPILTFSIFLILIISKISKFCLCRYQNWNGGWKIWAFKTFAQPYWGER